MSAAAPLAAFWRRPAARAGTWAALAAVVPLAARAHLASRIDSELEPGLSRALAVPVTVGSLDATLTGLVRLTDVTAGASMSAESIQAAFDPTDLAAGRLSPGEIRIVRPRLHLALGAGTAADPLWTRLREQVARRPSQMSAAPDAPHIQHLVVEDGILDIDLPGGASARAHRVEVRPHRGGAHLVAGPLVVTWRPGRWWQAHATFQRVAADIGGRGARRLLAVGGNVAIGRPGGHSLTLVNSSLSSGVGGSGDELRLTGNVAGREPGTLALTVSVDPGTDFRRARLDLEAVPLAVLAADVRPAAVLDAARGSGSISLERDGANVTGSASLDIEGVLVSHPLVSSEPVAVDGSIEGRGRLRRLAGRWLLAVEDLRLARAALTLDIGGLFEWNAEGLVAGPRGMPERAYLTVGLPQTPCAEAIAAIPAGLRQRLAGFEVNGVVGGHVELFFDRTDPDATDLEVELGIGGCRVVNEPALSDPLRLASPFDLRLADGSVVRIGDGPEHVQLARLPRHLVGAFVAAEDARFYRHDGFDPEQIERSLGIDVENGRLLRGGSTITQQLVKNVFLSHDRTLARKLQEAVLTWRVEARVDKRVILERYLNLIELGEDIHGVEAAARHWFAKPAERLGIREAAFLAALTPAPRTLSRLVRTSGGIAPAVANRVDVVLRAMRVSGVIDRATYERARKEPLHLAPTALGRR